MIEVDCWVDGCGNGGNWVWMVGGKVDLNLKGKGKGLFKLYYKLVMFYAII